MVCKTEWERSIKSQKVLSFAVSVLQSLYSNKICRVAILVSLQDIRLLQVYVPKQTKIETSE